MSYNHAEPSPNSAINHRRNVIFDRQRRQPNFAVERRYDVAKSATWAMPLLLGGNVLVRDASGVMLLTSQEP